MSEAKLMKFRELRKKKGVSLEEIAKELHISKAYISMIETGKRSLDYKMAIQMAKFFHTKPDNLFYDDLAGDK